MTTSINLCDSVPKESPLPVSRKRASHTKSRQGCQNCKKRHRKCDQTQPACLNCRRRGDACTWPTLHSPAIRFKAVAIETLRFARLEEVGDEQAFEYFDSHVLRILRICHPSPIWGCMLGFLAQQNIAFRRIGIAIGFQQRLLVSQTAGEQGCWTVQKSEVAYARALKSLRFSIAARSNQDAPSLALACTLMAYLASLRGAQSEILLHLRCGIDIVRGMCSHMQEENETLEICTLLRFLHTNSCFFTQAHTDTPRLGICLELDHTTEVNTPRVLNNASQSQHNRNSMLIQEGLVEYYCEQPSPSVLTGWIGQISTFTYQAILSANTIFFRLKQHCISDLHSEIIDLLETASNNLGVCESDGSELAWCLLPIDLAITKLLITQLLEAMVMDALSPELHLKALNLLKASPQTEAVWQRKEMRLICKDFMEKANHQSLTSETNLEAYSWLKYLLDRSGLAN